MFKKQNNIPEKGGKGGKGGGTLELFSVSDLLSEITKEPKSSSKPKLFALRVSLNVDLFSTSFTTLTKGLELSNKTLKEFLGGRGGGGRFGGNAGGTFE